jgi:hypothetical protein
LRSLADNQIKVAGLSPADVRVAWLRDAADEIERLNGALVALTDDLIARADDNLQVAVGNGAWMKACAALKLKTPAR